MNFVQKAELKRYKNELEALIEEFIEKFESVHPLGTRTGDHIEVFYTASEPVISFWMTVKMK